MDTESSIESILKDFAKVKESCDKIYKGINNRAECGELIQAYNEIIYYLNIIKEKSKNLDEVSIQDEQSVNQKRENLANDILFLAQHIRGCMESYKKFGEMIGKQENQENVKL